MKHAFFLLGVSFLTLIGKGQITVGPKVGVNETISTFSNSIYKVDPIGPGLNAGGFINYQFSKNFSTQLELLYSNGLTKCKIKGSSTVYDVHLAYFTVPPLAQYHLRHFFLETGSRIGTLLSANETDNGQTNSIKNSIKFSKFSWDLGLGGMFGKYVGLDLRSAADFSDVNNGSIDAGTIKANVISFLRFI